MKVITVARKPLGATVAETALRFGTSGLNISGSRVGTEPVETTAGRGFASRLFEGGVNDNAGDVRLGRWPANLILTPAAAAALDEQSGLSLSTGGRTANISSTSHIYGGGKGLGQAIDPSEVRGDPGYGDFGGASRYFKVVG